MGSGLDHSLEFGQVPAPPYKKRLFFALPHGVCAHAQEVGESKSLGLPKRHREKSEKDIFFRSLPGFQRGVFQGAVTSPKQAFWPYSWLRGPRKRQCFPRCRVADPAKCISPSKMHFAGLDRVRYKGREAPPPRGLPPPQKWVVGSTPPKKFRLRR